MRKKEISVAKPNTAQLLKSLRNLRKMLYFFRNVEKSACDDMAEVIDNILQARGAVDEMLVNAVSQSVELLGVLLEERGEGNAADAELLVVGRLLDRAYIEGIEIEQAQFFVKEISVHVEEVLAARPAPPPEICQSLNARATALFAEIKTRCAQHFAENARELERRSSLACSGGELGPRLSNSLVEIFRLRYEALVAAVGAVVAGETPPTLGLDAAVKETLSRLAERQTPPSLSAIKEMQKTLKATIGELEKSVFELKTESARRADAEKRVAALQTALDEQRAKYSEMLLSHEKTEPPTTRRHGDDRPRTAKAAEPDRLRETIIEDSKTIQELLSKYETKSAEAAELLTYKEKYAAAQEENARLKAAQTRLEEDYLAFHAELRRVKDRMRPLLDASRNASPEPVCKAVTSVHSLSSDLATQKNSRSAGNGSLTQLNAKRMQTSVSSWQIDVNFRRKKSALTSSYRREATAPTLPRPCSGAVTARSVKEARDRLLSS